MISEYLSALYILLPYVGLGDDLIEGLRVGGGGEHGEQPERREIIYCKRAILSLSSSKILTPHRPLRLASESSPSTKAGGAHTRRAERGMGGSIFWKTREIGLPSYSK
jgi:hypothetical protein